MEHVVFFPAPDRTPAFRRFPSLDEALRFVEHLRNVENVTEASVYQLTEVPLSFRPWYRVEVPAGAADGDGRPSQPTTVAEAIEAIGSATGIVVPDQPLGVGPVDAESPFTGGPIPAVAPPAPVAESPEANRDVAPADGRRGLGFFAR
ncbi:MAG: hypothetical protein IRZ02_07425 [Acidothermus sp.]|nr:hypothetical protein [Acidothermus sp.]MCL6538895.1 hypothetical protein [Acidothermus sp.]